MYPRSFMFSNAPFDGGSPAAIGYLACGPATNVTSLSKRLPDGSTIDLLCIGYLIDLDDVAADDAQVVERLADAFPDEKRFHQILGHINGRFALVVRHNDAWRVYNDASGMRTIYYTSGPEFMLSSHASLIARIDGSVPNTELFRDYRFGLPGLMSQYDGIRLMPSNLHLDPISGRLIRFWPVESRVERTLEDAYAIFSHYLIKACEGMLGRHDPVVSLTAGLDSRATFSATKAFDNVEYFSYHQSDLLSRSDIIAAKKICKTYHKPHTTIRIGRITDEQDRLKITEYTHIENLTECYIRSFGDKTKMHIRSNVGEIGKNGHIWRIDDGVIREGHPSDFIQRDLKKHTMSAEAERHANTQFDNMFAEIGYDPFSKELVCGYMPIDLFYWEHKAVTWHGPLILGSDFAFDTCSLYNSRILLEAMLSVNDTERNNRSIQKLFVERNAPEIAHLPINPPMPMGVQRILHGIRWRYRSLMNR